MLLNEKSRNSFEPLRLVEFSVLEIVNIAVSGVVGYADRTEALTRSLDMLDDLSKTRNRRVRQSR